MLAAGRARRFGGAKHLCELRPGETPLARVTRALRQAGVARLCVVLAADDATGRAHCAELEVASVPALPADEGRAASVRAAVASAEGADALLIALADQPLLGAADYAALIEAWDGRPDGLVRARYAGAPGTPVLFGAAHLPALRALRGKQGGREVIAAHAARVRAVELDPQVGLDIDDADDLAVARAILAAEALE